MVIRTDLKALQRAQRPPLDVDKAISRFAELLSDAPGDLSVWAKLDGDSLRFFILAGEDEALEDAIIEAEGMMLDEFYTPLLDFVITSREERIKALTGSVRPVISKP
jgi:hypothetical protein